MCLTFGFLRVYDQSFPIELEHLIPFSGPAPFNGRPLTPALLKFFNVLGIELLIGAFIIECAAAALLIHSTNRIISSLVGRRTTIAAVAMVAVVSIPLVIMPPRFYYPWDSLSPALSLLLLSAVLEDRSRAVIYVATVLAALNRETSLVVILGILLLDLLYRRGKSPPAGAIAAVWVATQLFIYAVLHLGGHDSGPSLLLPTGSSRLSENLLELSSIGNIISVLSYMGFLPIFWCLNRRRIHPGLQALELPMAAGFIALLVCGNITEPRIFSDLAALLFLGLSSALLASNRLNVPAAK